MLLLAYSWGLDPNTSQTNPLRPYSLLTAHISSSGYMRLYASGNATSSGYYVPATTSTVTMAYPGTAVTTVMPPPGGAGLPAPVYQVPTAPAAYTFYLGANAATPTFTGPSHDDFVNVAHAFWAILIAMCGGWFTCFCFSGP